jgi:hypothetical protein
MNKGQFSRDNHYVPQLYLRAFPGADGRVFAYRTLVSRPEISLWKPSSIKGVGYLSHLYTRIAAGGETDEIEKWFHREIETPADEPLRKAVSDEPLTSDDWHSLIRLLAAQIVRTPAYFVRNLPRWCAMARGALGSAIQDAARALEAARQAGKAPVLPESPYSEYLTLRTTTEVNPETGTAALGATVVLGRGMWLFAIRKALAEPEKVLHEHEWTILRPAEGMAWFTSDDPAVCLNYDAKRRYDFGGGWGRPGTEILLPLSPRHLLYTRIGQSAPRRGSVVSPEETEALRQVIATHAYHMVFAASPDPDVAMLRPRIVDEGLFRKERDLWLRWHEEQTSAEREVAVPEQGCAPT